MYTRSATAVACANIAFIKYWGNRDHKLRIPANGSISMNLEGLYTRTHVVFNQTLERDRLLINGEIKEGAAFERVSGFLDQVRRISDLGCFAEVYSENNFPTGAGVASSASAFAALSKAVVAAAGIELGESALSRLARLGSGSACRSIPGGFVEWIAGEDDSESYAYSIASPDHWDITDCITIISELHKRTSSWDGHTIADSSPLQAARVAGSGERLEICRNAILNKDFDSLADIAELDSNMMHAVIMTSKPMLIYWQPSTLAVMRKVTDWRHDGMPVFFTIDAGPNVHVFCLSSHAEQVSDLLVQLPGVKRVISAKAGGPARLVN